MTYANYFDSLKEGEVALSLIEWEQSLEGKKELAVYTLSNVRLNGSPFGEVKHFVVLANTPEEAKRLVAFNSWPNDYGNASRLYAALTVNECTPVSTATRVVDYFTETKGINHYATLEVMSNQRFAAMAYDTAFHYNVQPIFAAMLVYTGCYNINRRGTDMIELVMIAKREYRNAHPNMIKGSDVITNPRHWADYVCGGTWRK